MQVTKQNLSEVLAEIDSLPDGSLVSLDTETYGVNFEHTLFSLQISTKESDYFFLYDMIPGANPDYILDREEIKSYSFWEKDLIYAIHNAKFDLTRLHHEGIDVTKLKVFCTMASERLVKNNMWGKGVFTLKGCCARHKVEAKDDAVEAWFKENKEAKDYSEVPYDLMYEYGIQDTRSTLQLAISQQEKLQTMELSELASIEANLTTVLADTEITGIRIDNDYTKKAKIHEIANSKKYRENFYNISGREFMDSVIELPKVFESQGVKLKKNKFTGNYILDKTTLQAMDHPLAECVLNIRKSESLISVYSNLITYSDPCSMVHFSANQSGTDTGRMSYTRPAMQTIPKEDSEPYSARRCFIPREGFDFFMMDYDQQEYRVMLDYAAEMSMIEAISKGEDVHQATADMVGVSRVQAKTLNFAILYGSGINRIAEMLNIPYEKAKDLRNSYFKRLPNVASFIKRVRTVGEQRRYIYSWSKRRFYIDDAKWAYKLPNHLIQGSCADIIKSAMVEIAALLRTSEHGSRIVLQVHDELLFEIHKSEHHFVPKIKKIMESIYPAKNNVTLTVGVDMSETSWAEKDKVKYEC